jgi:hypothetical protein
MGGNSCPELLRLGRALCAAMEYLNECSDNSETTQSDLLVARRSLDAANSALNEHRDSCPKCQVRWVEFLENDPRGDTTNSA